MKRSLSFFFLSLYLFTASGHLYVLDETLIAFLTKRIVEDKSLSLPDSFYPISPPPVIGRDNKLYSPCGIAQSILAIPFYLFGKLIDMAFDLDKIVGINYPYILSFSLFNSFVTALSALIFFIISRRLYSQKTSFLITLFYGMGSMAWPYSRYFFNQPLTALCLLIAFYALYLYIQTASFKHLILSGSFIGFSILTRTDNLIVIPVFFLYLLLSLKNEQQTRPNLLKTIAVFFLPIVLSVMMVALYNFIRFDSFFQTGYGDLKNSEFYSPIEGLYGMLFSSGKSIFLYNPILFLLPFCLKDFFLRRKNEAILCGLLFFVFLFTYSGWGCWDGGGTWGPRFLLPIIPFLILPMGLFIEEKRGFKKAILSVLFLFSIFVQIVGISVDFNAYIKITRKLYNSDLPIVFYPEISPVAGHTKILMNKLFGYAPGDPVVKGYKKPLDFWFISLAKLIPFEVISCIFLFLVISATINLYLLLRKLQQ